MPNLNKTLHMGNLTRDPELKFTPKGTAVCDFGLAVNEKWKDSNGNDKEETLFLDVTFFGKVAEIIAKHVKKGQPLYVEGKLKMETWEDKATGQNRSKMKIVGENFQFLSAGEKNSQSSDRPARQEPRQETRREEPRREAPMPNRTPDDDEDSIPF